MGPKGANRGAEEGEPGPKRRRGRAGGEGNEPMGPKGANRGAEEPEGANRGAEEPEGANRGAEEGEPGPGTSRRAERES